MGKANVQVARQTVLHRTVDVYLVQAVHNAVLQAIAQASQAARFRSSRSISPSFCTGRYVTRYPYFSRRWQASSTALCSVTAVMMWLPFSLYISATPLMARLSLSVAPEVNMISFAVAPISLAMLSRDCSTAASATHPKAWLRLAALPNFSTKKGSIL